MLRIRRSVTVSARKWFLTGVVAATVVLIVGVCGKADAFVIPTGSDDVHIRWDNTFRYTLSQRVQSQNNDILGDPNIDDGDRNFDEGIVSNRLDLLSEADVVFKDTFGMRASGAFWYDAAYEDIDNNSAFSSNHIGRDGQPSAGLSDYTDRVNRGPSGELLDAFAFGKFNIADMPLNLKAGRHTIYWGESMLGNGGAHGISYGQAPLDIGKALATPGIELKELFRPLNQISMQFQPLQELSIAAQYYLQWEAHRFPGPGSYFDFANVLGEGESLIAGFNPATGQLVRYLNTGDVEPDQARDWGVSARWSPNWIGDGTFGFYYRNFSDKSAQIHISPVTGTYNWAYPDDIDLFGISFAKQIFGFSVGSEVSYRQNMPLASTAAIIGPFPGATAASLPGDGDTFGARGDTWHGLINLLYLFNKMPIFDSASLLAEFTWCHWQRVSQHEELFKGRSGYTARDRVDKDYVGGSLNFTPTWFQVLTGVDLSMPLSVFTGLIGNAATNGGGCKNSGSYGAGFSADINQRHKVELKYSGFFGDYDVTPTGLVTTAADSAALKDRGMITLTVKTSF
ncbi:MAG: DUF1302 domain-containing protein [Pseudomonadota bacterium]